MAKNKKPNRKYDSGRWLRRTSAAQERRRDAKPLDQGQQRDLSLVIRLSYQTMLTNADQTAWSALAAAINVALVLCERGIGGEYVRLVYDVQEALARCRARAEKTGSWAFDGDGTAAMRLVIDLVEEQLQAANRSEIREVHQEVYRRVLQQQAFGSTP